MCKVYSLYKTANTLWKWKVPILPRLIYCFIRFVFGPSIPYTATIGRGSSFGCGGIGVVIHPRAVVGENCTIGQCVTIGGRKGHPDVPVIGNNVLLGVGAKILGPLTIGDNASIGANAVVIHDVPANATAVGVPARILTRKRQHKTDEMLTVA
jgi:serine O-acetyltransferase